MIAACCSHRSIMSRAGWSSFKNKCFVQACCVLKSNFLVIEGWIPLKDCLSIVMTKRRKTLQRWDKEGQMEVLISWLKPRVAFRLLWSSGDQVNLRTTPYLPLLAVGRGGGLAPQQVTSPHSITCLPLVSGATQGLSLPSGRFLVFPANTLSMPFPCSGRAEQLLLTQSGFGLAWAKFSTHFCYSLWGTLEKADTLELPSKWPSPWAAFSLINQKYPFIFVSTIWPASTKENYICVYLNSSWENYICVYLNTAVIS